MTTLAILCSVTMALLHSTQTFQNSVSDAQDLYIYIVYTSQPSYLLGPQGIIYFYFYV